MFFYYANPSCAVTERLKLLFYLLFVLSNWFYHPWPGWYVTTTKNKEQDWCYIVFAEQKYCPNVKPRPESL